MPQAQPEKFLNGKTPLSDTNFFVASTTDLPVTGSPPDRSGEAPWSELEKDFFASAPPDVAQPPPEPMRFDDLVPIEAPRPKDVAAFKREIPTGMRRAANAVSATRASLKRVFGSTGRGARPALVSVAGRAAAIASAAARGPRVAFAAAARGSKAAITAARGASARTLRAGGRFGAALNGRRAFAAALTVAIAVFTTGISVAVVSSRSAPSHTASAAPAPAPAIAAPAPPAVEPPVPSVPAVPTTVAEAAPANPPVVAEAAPAEAAPSPPAFEPRPSSAAEPRPSHDAAPKRPARAHKRHGNYSARNDLIVPSFMTASPRQDAGGRPTPAPAPANRPFFTR